METYLNHGNDGFKEVLNSEIYVDKTELIAYTNKKLHTIVVAVIQKNC